MTITPEMIAALGVAGGGVLYQVITARAQADAIRANATAAAAAQARADAAHDAAVDAKKSATAAGLVAANNAGSAVAGARESGSHADDIRAMMGKLADLAALIPAPGQSAIPLPRPPVPSPPAAVGTTTSNTRPASVPTR